MRRIRAALTALAGTLLLAVTTLGLPSTAHAAELVEITDFGPNPGGTRMHVYVPDNTQPNPPVVVAMHGCGGDGPGFAQSSGFNGLADQHGFIVIYPTATQQTAFGTCFDVWSPQSKTRDGGSDPVSIASMVSYTHQQYGGDPARTFATGSSSGGMETNALLALYPDVFAAGAAFMGVPFSCFLDEADFPPWNSQCVNGQKDETPQTWGDAVRQAHPGYNGPRPPIQLWHGTDDTLVPFQLLREATEQWTDVHGLSQTPSFTDQPQPGWERENFADAGGTVWVESITVRGAGHTLPMSGMAAEAISFFGIAD
ncbi:extracellular catalytic domain type 1 short-chain-length polyhydroxyalkanoate depolymerase [Streptomyces profundus]|uniref:extracellular catalytic domain type 1 short-chain-length polyhydroxyalkanoate depolymerase n=1 Tax=Streptomyces profundus TaxID=2867410 RepID=UPI001D16343A|nr:PHB depolymerase family esterase [Streptomyces sp. MA3_2.13]UED86713.1 PHB depolymerase family esterase [Streptomyces sp. MA3_2.13]